MRFRLHLQSVAFLLSSMGLCAQDVAAPTLSTYVLAPGTTSFQAEDGWTVVCQEGTTMVLLGPTEQMTKNQHVGVRACQPWTVGRRLNVWGKRDKRGHRIVADQIAVDEQLVDRISGFALVDRVEQPETAGAIVFRADGYVLRTTTHTKLLDGANAVKTLEAVSTNMWVRYNGKPQRDGSVLVTDMLVTPNTVAKKEDKLRTQSEFDASAVKEQDRQGKVNKFFVGLDAKRIPAYGDKAMQGRIDRIGSSLVPAYQAALQKDEPSRIPFSFQLVDLAEGPDVVALPSGIILVPYQIVQSLNDAQLAAVLAANIGDVMQKQALRNLPTMHTLTAVNLAGLAAGAVVPGLGLVTGLGTSLKQDAMVKAIHEQDLRQGMALLHDAGYNLTEAPMAWWLIHSNPKKKHMPNGTMPADADYCYQLLGTVWRNTLAATKSLP